jgi:hypothetical protein
MSEVPDTDRATKVSTLTSPSGPMTRARAKFSNTRWIHSNLHVISMVLWMTCYFMWYPMHNQVQPNVAIHHTKTLSLGASMFGWDTNPSLFESQNEGHFIRCQPSLLSFDTLDSGICFPRKVGFFVFRSTNRCTEDRCAIFLTTFISCMISREWSLW